ncbi:hypothetical protein SeLEV6574_g00940 [Synchytrium endobioticum]|nr:hypothetical protein SeLEV6574_g00940 [Synchytrium endobioticum]
MTVSAPRQSSLYQPFRAIGYVTTGLVSPIVYTRGTTYYLLTSVGNTFHIYDLEKLRLLFVGPRLEGNITGMAAVNDLTIAAVASDIIICQRAKETCRYSLPVDGAVTYMSLLGDLLLTLCADNVLRAFNVSATDVELIAEIEFDSDFTATTLLHPSTYVNKVLVASREGTMQLWNIRSMKLVHTFSTFSSPIAAISQSPVVDVVAIGLLNGRIILYNIRQDQRLFEFAQEGKVTFISFRTDEQQIMATANSAGDIALWSLENRRLSYNMKGAHDGSTTLASFLSGQPLLVSAGADNAVKTWIFDPLEIQPRLLRSRSGHHLPPTHIKFYGNDGYTILSAGRDRSLRTFSVIRDSRNVELSQGSMAKKLKANKNVTTIDELKLPVITKFAASPAKEKEWNNIVSCHLNDHAARTWSYTRKAIGKNELPSLDDSAVTAVAISHCGNFAFLGSSKGAVYKYNLQSGQHRKTFSKGGHTKAIVEICTDTLNKIVITSSLDEQLHFWDFEKATILHSIALPSTPSQMTLHKGSNLLALASDDLSIRVIDVETTKVVREYVGHRNQITGLCFAPDGRWIVSSSLDGTIRTWDVVSGSMIDVMKLEDGNVATSIGFSPTGDFLASVHADKVGIYLWSNRAQYENLSLHALNPESDDVGVTCLPSTSSGTPSNNNANEGEEDEENEQCDNRMDLDSSGNDMWVPKDGDMLSFSSAVQTRWETLLKLDSIKKRNKPREPPKAPERPPFFLPTVAGAQPKFATPPTSSVATAVAEEGSRVLNFTNVDSESEFWKTLRHCHDANDYTQFYGIVKRSSPATLDLELRTMNTMSAESLLMFLDALRNWLESRCDFEVVETLLHVCLRLHSDVMLKQESHNKKVGDALKKMVDLHRSEWARLESRFQGSTFLSDWARGL